MLSARSSPALWLAVRSRAIFLDVETAGGDRAFFSNVACLAAVKAGLLAHALTLVSFLFIVQI